MDRIGGYRALLLVLVATNILTVGTTLYSQAKLRSLADLDATPAKISEFQWISLNVRLMWLEEFLPVRDTAVPSYQYDPKAPQILYASAYTNPDWLRLQKPDEIKQRAWTICGMFRIFAESGAPDLNKIPCKVDFWNWGKGVKHSTLATYDSEEDDITFK